MDKKSTLYIALSQLAQNGFLEDSMISSLNKEEIQLVMEIQEAGLLSDAMEIIDSVNLQRNWGILKDKLEIGNYKKEKRINFLKAKVFRYAAVVTGLALISSSIYFWQKSSAVPNTIIDWDKDQIILTQADGSKKILSEEPVAEIKMFDRDGEEIGVQRGKMLDYSKPLDESEEQRLVYNELTVPYGKRFDLILSDGTQISLNSGTHVRYPVTFSKKGKREVQITGEAYFNVNKDKTRPFRVLFQEGFTVEVLGTEFNVSTYTEKGDVETVLVEGAVALYENERESEKQFLEPGHKAEWNKINRDIEISPANVRLYVGWLQGELIFKNALLRDIVPKLERSYDVKINYDVQEFAYKRYDASFHVDVETIEEVMHHLSKVAPINYQIEERKIILDKRNEAK